MPPADVALTGPLEKPRQVRGVVAAVGVTIRRSRGGDGLCKERDRVIVLVNTSHAHIDVQA